jgi:hypothetical protein
MEALNRFCQMAFGANRSRCRGEIMPFKTRYVPVLLHSHFMGSPESCGRQSFVSPALQGRSVTYSFSIVECLAKLRAEYGLTVRFCFAFSSFAWATFLAHHQFPLMIRLRGPSNRYNAVPPTCSRPSRSRSRSRVTSVAVGAPGRKQSNRAGWRPVVMQRSGLWVEDSSETTNRLV